MSTWGKTRVYNFADIWQTFFEGWGCTFQPEANLLSCRSSEGLGIRVQSLLSYFCVRPEERDARERKGIGVRLPSGFV